MKGNNRLNGQRCAHCGDSRWIQCIQIRTANDSVKLCRRSTGRYMEIRWIGIDTCQEFWRTDWVRNVSGSTKYGTGMYEIVDYSNSGILKDVLSRRYQQWHTPMSTVTSIGAAGNGTVDSPRSPRPANHSHVTDLDATQDQPGIGSYSRTPPLQR